jgi:repressor LexA
MLPPLTKRQKEILDFVKESSKQNGYAPSLEEVRKEFKLKAVSTVHEHIENLKNKGYIKKEMNQARGVQIITKKNNKDYSSLKLTGFIIEQEAITNTNITESYVIDEKFLDKATEHKIYKVSDDSLDKYAISKNDLLLVSNSQDITERKILLIKKKNSVIVQKANKSDLIDIVGYVKLVIKIF